jgi:ABC-type uncharacterized transport system YnjBCD substrate-binding protein
VRSSLFYRGTKNGYKNHSEKGVRGVDVETASAAASLDALIERRSRERDEANSIEAMWAKSEQAHREKRQQMLREEWCDFHLKMQQLHLSLADEHASKRSRLLLELAEEVPG